MTMPADDRKVLEVLKFELDFLEKGGYGRSVRTPWKPTSVFQDSPSCLNFSDPKQTHPCNECLLEAFVPPERRGESVPCHHIPLTSAGDTVESAERRGNQGEREEVVKAWLRQTIRRLEEEQKALEAGDAVR
jgi:hypothetical protein